MLKYMAIAVIVLAILAAAINISRRTRKDRLIGFGFQEYVRVPRIRKEMAATRARHEAELEALARSSPDEIVRLLLDNERHYLASGALKRLGVVAVPHLISALGQPEFQRPLTLITVLRCLQEFCHPECVAAVAGLVEVEDKEVRKEAALLLGAIGTDSAIAPIRRALADEDESVRSYAIMGILRAVDSKRAASVFRSTVYEAVQPLALGPRPMLNGNAAECLLALDRDRAVAFLTASSSLTAGRGGLCETLRALRKANVLVSKDQLLTVIASAEREVTQHPNDDVYAEALQLLARFDSDETREAIRRGTESASQRVREGAAEALALSKGLEKPYDVAFDRLHQVGWEGLTDTQEYVLAVRILIDEVNNGGFSQYFVNSSGNHWRQAERGLEAIGAISDLALLRRATANFGTEGPSSDNDERHRQLARVVKADDDNVFAPLENQFYKDESDREVLLLRYMVAHQADFRIAPKR